MHRSPRRLYTVDHRRMPIGRALQGPTMLPLGQSTPAAPTAPRHPRIIGTSTPIRACHPGVMVDWQLAGKVAEGVAALQPSGDPEPFKRLVEPADESERLVRAYTGLLPAAGALPVAESIDRRAWIDANLDSMR